MVLQRSLLGNAAMTAVMSGPPELAPSSWAGQMMLAGQSQVGNQAVAAGAVTMPVVTPVEGPKKPEQPKPVPVETRPKAGPPARKPEVKDQKGKPEGPDKPEKTEAGANRSPAGDPKFQALKKDVNAKKRKVGRSHPPATAEAGAAQAAAKAPADDQEARGKADHAEEMEQAEAKDFDKKAFIEAVKKAIEDRSPKNLEEADEFGGSGKAEEVKTEVQGKVGEGKDASAKQIADTTAETPQPAPDAKQVVPMAPDQVPGKPGAPNPNQAAPDVLPPAATDMSAGPAKVNDQMAAAQVTEKQLSLENSREPSFGKAVEDKKEMEAHSAEAPGELRKDEAKEIKQVKNTAAAKGSAAMTGMHATRVGTGQKVGAGKEGAKGRDEEKRLQVTAILQKVFDKTKLDVEKILSDLDKEVDRQFTDGEKRARDRFTREHTDGMRRYKAERYGGWDGGFLWAKDKLFDLPEEANRIYEDAKKNYLAAMDLLITEIANTVERELKRATERIKTGRTDLKAALDKLPADLKEIGKEAITEFEGKFDELKDTVDDKGSALVDTLATKYTDAVKSVDEEIAKEKEKNKGLVTKAAEAIGDVIETIKELGRMLLNVLRKAASAIGLILKDPIGFLGRLIDGVGGGLKLFKQKAGKHLEQGALTWLLGSGVTAGLQLPATFDVLGILVMIAAMLGISWANIRSRLVRKVPEQAVLAAETALPVVSQVKRRGVAGMWDDLKARVGDLKKDLISKLVSYLLPTIVLAGITWIVSLFNPASAFIRACKMIIDIIRFIVTQAKQIFEFINAVLDAVIAIARGGSGGVPGLIERALARSIPVLIGALAAILGIGGIAGKVREIFQQISRPVNRAIDAVVNKMVDLVKKLWTKIKPKPKPKTKPKPDKDKDKKPKDKDKPARPKKPRRPAKTKRPRKPEKPKVRDKPARPKKPRKEDEAPNINWRVRGFKPKVIKQSFTMTSGEGHSLTADVGKSDVEFKIASKFAGEVRAVFADLQKEVKAIPNLEDRKAAEAELAKLKRVLDDLDKAETQWNKNKSATLKKVTDRVNKRKTTKNVRKRVKSQAEADRLTDEWMTEAEHRLYRDLEQALALHIKALSQLKGMEQFVKKPGVRQIPRGYDVRERLYNYNSGWKALSTNWRAKEKKALVDTVRAILAKGYTRQAKADLVPLDKKQQLPETWAAEFDQRQLKAADVAKTKHVVDHEEPLATHWLRKGRGSGDKARRDHNVDQSGWRLVTEKYNTSRKADGDHFSDNLTLKDTFTSDLADGGIPNAKRIDGKPLLDKDGKPIT